MVALFLIIPIFVSSFTIIAFQDKDLGRYTAFREEFKEETNVHIYGIIDTFQARTVDYVNLSHERYVELIKEVEVMRANWSKR